MNFGIVEHAGPAAVLLVLVSPTVAQERGIPDRLGDLPEKVSEVRDPIGPVTAEQLANGDFVVPGEPVHDNQFRVFGMLDRLEYQSDEGDSKYVWDGFAYAGGDFDRLWIESEGEGLFDGRLEAAELQVLYSRAISPYWNVQAGVRHDFRPDPSLWYGVLGFEGLNFFWSEVQADLYLSEDGDLSATVEGEFDEYLTQRLVLQPRIDVNAQAQDVDEFGLGAGITSLEAGVRLRYEFAREFAPYIGASWLQRVGETADRLSDDEDAGKFSIVLGLRVWF